MQMDPVQQGKFPKNQTSHQPRQLITSSQPISKFVTFKQPTHQKYTICTNACHVHILPAHISIWKCEMVGAVKCAAKTQHTQLMRCSNKNRSTFKNCAVQKTQEYRHVRMPGECGAVYHNQNQTDYFT
jgi:hypothetical protein